MPGAPIEKRVELLENIVMGPDGLVARVKDLSFRVDELRDQLFDFRDSTGREFSALRQEMQEGFTALRVEMRTGNAELHEKIRVDMHIEFEAFREAFGQEIRQEIRQGDEDTRSELRAEMQRLNDETRVHMLVLHEAVIARIELLDEGWHARRQRAPRKKAR